MDTRRSSIRTPDLGAGLSQKKKDKTLNANAKIFEQLVDLQTTDHLHLVTLESEAYNNLREQLSKSQRKSQKLNLIRETGSSFTNPAAAYNNVQTLEGQSIQNETLLKIYTDSGTFSKTVAMTVAASVLDTKFPYDVVQNSLDNRKKEELKKFCDDINFILGLPENRIDINDYRRIWHLYTIFTSGMEQHARLNSANDSSTRKDDRSDAKLDASPYGAGVEDMQRLSTYRGLSTWRKRPEETPSDTEIIESLKSLNQSLYHALRDPLARFLIVFGRYLEMGHVSRSQSLRHNSLNGYILRYLEKVAYISVPPAARASASASKPAIVSKGSASADDSPQGYGRDSKRAQGFGRSKHPSIPDSPSTASGSTSNASTAQNSLLNMSTRFSLDAGGNLVPMEVTNSGGHHLQALDQEEEAEQEESGPWNGVPAPKLQKSHWVENYFRGKTICLEGCRYDVVRRIALELEFREVDEHDVWNIIWTDTPIPLEKALDMRRFQNTHTIFLGKIPPVQKANHFPGMNEICRKDKLARNLNRMRKCFPEDYNFFPRTWSLPADMADLLTYSRLKKNATYICKPDSGCQGKGIFLARNIRKLNPFAKLICQLYIPKPLLIDGYKFDLRIYILITSCDPLRVFIYNEGIARFATIKYCAPNDTNIDMIYMHLTNYSLNKFSQSYDGDGSKRKMSAVFKILADNNFDTQQLQDSIDSVVIKTLIAAQPTLRHYYRASFPRHEMGSSCFEVLGFDILIDRSLKPYLLEVNHSPSFNLDLPVDADVKESLLKDTFKIIYLGDSPGSTSASPRSSHGVQARNGMLKSDGHSKGRETSNRYSKIFLEQMRHEETHLGNFRLIYPLEDTQKYSPFFDQSACPGLMNESGSKKRPKILD